MKLFLFSDNGGLLGRAQNCFQVSWVNVQEAVIADIGSPLAFTLYTKWEANK